MRGSADLAATSVFVLRDELTATQKRGPPIHSESLNTHPRRWPQPNI